MELQQAERTAAEGRRSAGRARYLGWLTLSVLALVLAAGLAVTIGPAEVSLTDVAASLAAHLGLPGAAEVAPLTDSIVWQLRLPRVLTAAAVGAGLALSGAVMQSVTRNPLADPYLLGLSSGASLGAVCVIILGVAVALPAAAFLRAHAPHLSTLSIARVVGTIT
ncbi:MAG: iron chelate uptake ABC transporter family permease subunit, partial [Cryobacterium sp.]|nr:iron chelate uptake ABC transporter family permease subunit [Cryobacterium sp.]